MNIDKLDLEEFVLRAEAMHKRLRYLYQSSNTLSSVQELLPQAYMELGNVSEIVQLAIEELKQQNEELIKTRNILEAECQHYQDLFEFAPDGYLVTNTEGIILEANQAIVELFKISKQYIVGKPIISFVTLEYRQCFRRLLIQLHKLEQTQELIVSFKKYNGDLFEAGLTVKSLYNQQTESQVFIWSARDITERKHVKLEILNSNLDLTNNRPLYKYCKGEFIELNPQSIWYVAHGLIKLSTICQTGEELLVGLAKQGMVFGSSMTSQKTYQAIALSDVSLVLISLEEIVASPIMSQTLVPKINQRLQQTESFLVICRIQKVQDRLLHLLQLLKQEIGQKVPRGTRLSIRLTHEEIASACSTTRVTITRLMGQLKKQGKISFDSKKHIIINY